MQLRSAGLTDVGLKRSNNQDSYLIDEDLGLFVVADGMGGHKGGEVASSIAVQTVRDVIRHSYENERGVSARDLLLRAYQAASERIFARADVEVALRGMGTTMVAALYRDDRIYIANVGDSRAYLMSHGCLWQITEDHSLVSEHIRAGLLQEDQIDQFTSKNVITRSVGYERDVTCDVIEREIDADDMFLICSDGLSGMLSDQQILDILKKNSLQQNVTALVEAAKKSGGDDNITVMILQADEAKTRP